MSLNNRKQSEKNKSGTSQSTRKDFLQGQVTAAQMIARAAQSRIDAEKLPEVKKCSTSAEAWQQFCFYLKRWTKHLTAKKEVSENGEKISAEDPLTYEGIGSAIVKSFGHWLWMLIQEIIIVIALAFNWLFVNIWKLICFIGFQIARFFRWCKERLYWNSLKRDMVNRHREEKFKAWKEKKRLEIHEMNVARQVAAVERKTQRQEEAERRAAIRKEENAIKQARLEEAAAKKHTEEIQAELAAIALRRREEEDRVSLEIQRKEEAEKMLMEAKETEEKERAALEAKRLEEEEARKEALKMEEESRQRLEVLRLEEEERQRLAAVREQELNRLKAEEERLKEEKLKAEEEAKRLEEARIAEEARLEEEKKRIEEERKAEEEKKRQEALRIIEEEKKKAEEQARKIEADRLAEEKAKADEAKRLEEVRAAEEKAAEAKRQEEIRIAEEKAAEAKRLAEAELLEEKKKQEEASKRKTEEAKRKEQLRRQTENIARIEGKQSKQEETRHKEKPPSLRSNLTEKPALAAMAVRDAVKTLPATMPNVSIPNAEERERLLTEARDKTSNFIRRAIIRSEIETVYGNPEEAIKLTAIKYAIIALVTSAGAYIGVLNSSEIAVKPGAGSFLLLFFSILILGAALEIGGGILCGILLNHTMTVSKTAVLEKNSVYSILHGLLFSFAGALLAFSREKFLAVFAALILLAMIGRIWVLYRVSKGKKGYSLLVYFLVVFAVVAVVMLAAIVLRGPIMNIWHALK